MSIVERDAATTKTDTKETSNELHEPATIWRNERNPRLDRVTCQHKKFSCLDGHRLKRTEASVSRKKPQPGKIGNLWAIFDPTEDNNVSQRRNENGEVMTFPSRQHVRAYLKEQMAAERIQ
jgi:hypothetical protein